ncbi:MAG: PQQ-binding-like beta-propeller repeat protein [Phycisphaerae bacterium]
MDPNRCWMVLVILSSLFLSTESTIAGDWPNWRGVNHDGISTEADFKKSWNGDLKTLWARRIGAGYSGIICVKGRVYTCGTEDGNQVLVCLSADKGSVLWKQAIEKSYRNNFGDGTRGTPTWNKGRVYIMGALGTVACFKAEDGSKIWSRRYEDVPQWGYSGSVLIQGNLAIVATGGSGGGLRALDKKTGDEIWTCGGDRDSGYSTPCPFELEGTRYICALLGKSVVIAESKTGREAFSMPWKTDWKVNAATPIFHDGHLFISSGYSTGCGLYKLRKKGNAIEADEVWRSKVLKNKFQTPVIHQGTLYSYDQSAFKCVDWMTGRQRWREHGAHGSVLLADGHLIALSGEGRLRIARASPSGFEATGEAEILEGRCWTVPTLSEGRLYARNMDRIVCIDFRE